MDWDGDGKSLTTFGQELQTDHAPVAQRSDHHFGSHLPCHPKTINICSDASSLSSGDELEQRVQHMQISGSSHEVEGQSSGYDSQDSGETSAEEIVRLVSENYAQNDEGDTKLHLAVIHNDLSTISDILRFTWAPELLDIQNNRKQTALHLAVITRQSQVARTLVVCGANLLAQNQTGMTVLHLAVEEGDIETIMMLTQPLDSSEVQFAQSLPFNVQWHTIPQRDDLRNYQGESKLYTAAKAGFIHIVKYLADYCKHDINAQEHKGGKSILHLAVEGQNIGLIKFLLKHGEVEHYIEDYSGNTPFLLSRYHRKSLEAILHVLPQMKGAIQEQFCDASSDEDEDAPPNRMSGH